MPPGTEVLKEQLQHEHNGTTDHRYLKQACTEPCSRNAGHQRHGTGSRALGRVDNGWEGHGRQRHIGHIIQKRLNEAVFDGLADQCERCLLYTSDAADE